MHAQRGRDVRGPRHQPEPRRHVEGQRRVPAVSGLHRELGPGPHRVLLHRAGLGVLGDEERHWGDATTATPEMGERYLALGVKSTLAVLENIEKTFAAMPPR